MIPEEIFKRRPRHNNTPASVLLIITNFIVTSAAMMICVSNGQVGWFFWVIEGFLAVYNVYTIRHNRDEFANRGIIISYSLSLVILIAVFFLLKGM